LPILYKYSLHYEKCLHVRNPWDADKGDGCEVFNILFFTTLTDFALSCAGLPHNKYTTPVQFLFIAFITSSVNFSHPHFWWEFGLLSSTVSDVFNKNTPCWAHFVRSPWLGFLKFSFLSA
jgi:hypothetical protein